MPLSIDGGAAILESSEFDRILNDDARKVARRTLRRKFGRLGNNRILAILRPAATDAGLATASDAELLDRWFDAYAKAVEQLRAATGEQAEA